MYANLWNRLLVALLLVTAALFNTIPAHLMAYAPANKLTTAQEQDDSQVQYEVMSTQGDNGAVAFIGEAGYRNFRGSGTYGVYFTPCQRFKITGEYLTQNLKYHFISEHEKKWVSQYAIGAEYQFLLSCSRFQSIDLGAAYSHAFSHKLSNKHPTSLCTIKRRIAGSNGVLSFLGTTLSLWRCAFLSAELDYDWVHYHRKFESNRTTNGFGGTLSFVQQFAKDFSLNLGVEFRQPFTAYLGSLTWNRLYSSWGFNVGIFGNITDGKRGVSDINTGGIQLGFSFGGKGSKCCRPCESCTESCYERAYCNVSQWASTPAVYVPVVLAIADKKQNCLTPPPPPCVAPTSTTIPNQQVGLQCSGNTLVVVPLAPFFTSSQPLTFSETHGALSPGHTISLDPNTGVLTLNNTAGFPSETVSVTVTGTSSCGSTSQTFQVFFCLNNS